MRSLEEVLLLSYANIYNIPVTLENDRDFFLGWTDQEFPGREKYESQPGNV